MSKLLLVDGNSIINRAFFAVIGRAPMTAPDGTPTGALNGFFNTLLSVKDEINPDKICVLFDLKAPTFRHKMYPDYKAQRKGMMPELSAQMPIAKEILDLIGIKRMEMEGYEADDLIGTLSLLGANQGDKVFILSGDHDDFQLIDDNVSVILPQSGKGKPPRVLFDREMFEETYNVKPEVFVYVKALMGDNSDNIKGVEKVGEKTAFKLIADYGSIDGIFDNLDKLTPSLRSHVSESRELIDMNIKLCSILRDVPVPYGPEQTEFKDIADPQGLHDKLASLGLRSLIKKFGLEDMRVQTFESQGSDYSSYLEEFDQGKDSISIDKNGLPSGTDIDVGFTEDKVLLLEGTTLYVKDPDEALKALDLCESVRSYDYKINSKILSRIPLKLNAVYDSSVMGYVLNVISGNSPDFMRLFENTFAMPYPIEEKTGQISLFDTEDEAESLRIKGQKLLLNRCIAKALMKKAEEEGLTDLLTKIEFPLTVTLDAMERNGMNVSMDSLKSLHSEFTSRLKELEDEIHELTGIEFNIGSPKQLSEVLFDADKLNLPHGKKGKTGVYSTSADELNRIADFHPAVPKILEWRAISKLDSTYAAGLLPKIREDGRIHTTFTQAMTNTGRLSSVDPNLQNIPVRSEEGARIRECFTAPEGKVLVDADYSQIELRLLAAMSGDEVMTEAFLHGEDIHRRTASKVFGVPEDEVTSEQRAAAKTVNFSIVYGVSDFGLSTDLGISFREAGDLIKSYGEQFPKITSYLDGLKKKGEEDGFVTTLYGRKRILTELKSPNRNLRNFGLRAAMNTPVQGTAADIIKIAMNRVYKALKEQVPESKLIMQVHDELIVECDKGKEELVSSILKKEMESAAELAVPLVSEVGTGSNWLEAK
ncbi:MAG: DNA polymerase I [Clostridiales bacterium]|nr:DNA polymerase I [Clostridiales bacterium]